MIEQLIVRPSRAFAFVAVAAMLALSAFWSAAETRAAQPLAGEFVGRVAGTDAFIGVATDGVRFNAFVCDGTFDGASTWRWFTGNLVNGRALIQDPNNVALSFDFRQGQISNGQVAISSGQVLEFSGTPALGAAGFFRANLRTEEGVFTGGWIALDNTVPDDRAGNQRDDRASNVSAGFDLRGAVRFRPASDPAAAQFQGVGDFNIEAGTAVLGGQVVNPSRVTAETMLESEN